MSDSGAVPDDFFLLCGADSLLEQSQQRHNTRKLRNKAPTGSSSRRVAGDEDDGKESLVVGGGASVSGGGGSAVPMGSGGAAGGSGGGYHGIGTASNGLGSLLQNMGFSSSDVLALTAAGRLGFQFNTGVGESNANTSRGGTTDAANGKSVAKAKGKKRKADNTAEAAEALATWSAAQGASQGVFAGLDSGVGGLNLTPAAFLDALGLGGAGSGFGAGGLSGLLEGTGAHAPSIIVGPGGANSTKSKKKKQIATQVLLQAAAQAAGEDVMRGASPAPGGDGSSIVMGGMIGSKDGSAMQAGASATGGSGASANGAAGSGAGPASAAAGILAAGPGGRLRWDIGKSLLHLTAAKDFEIEADLIHLRKIGGKRRRR